MKCLDNYSTIWYRYSHHIHFSDPLTFYLLISSFHFFSSSASAGQTLCTDYTGANHELIYKGYFTIISHFWSYNISYLSGVLAKALVAQSDFPWRPLVIRENCIPIWWVVAVSCSQSTQLSLWRQTLCFKFHYSSARRLWAFADMLGSPMHTTGNCSYLLAMKTRTFCCSTSLN